MPDILNRCIQRSLTSTCGISWIKRRENKTMPRKKSRSAAGSGTIRQRKDGSWEGRYTVGTDPITGKQIQKSIYGKRQAEVRKRLQQICAEIDDGTYIAPSKISVEQWLNTWLEDYCVDVKPRTIEKYSSTVRNRLIPYLGKVKLCDLSTHHIQHVYNAFLRGSDGFKQLSTKSIRDTHGTLHRALEQAVDLNMIKANPSNKCKLPRIEKTEIQPMDGLQIGSFLQSIKGNRFEFLYLVDLFTGMRLGEILALSWNCIDYERGTIRIYRKLHQLKRCYEFGSLKNDKPRAIAVAPYVLEVLKEQRKRQALWQLNAGAVWKNKENLIFTDEIGNHLCSNTVRNTLKRITQDMGLSSFRFHDLRHSYAVASLQAGDDIKTLQQNLGHYTAAFTMDVYGHCTEQMRQASAARMESFIKGVSYL